MSDREAEAELVAAAQSDPSRFHDLYSAHVGFIHALAWTRVRDRAAAEDVTADTFRRALGALPRYEPRGIPFRAWLCRICINVINDELTRRQRTMRLAMNAPGDSPTDPASDDIAEAETRAMVHALIEQLPPDHRAVIMLRFADDLSVADVAARLGRSPDAVKQLQRRALAGLRALASQGEVDE
jgi:RNA polymerase sigma-70 factor, ECF subfamily